MTEPPLKATSSAGGTPPRAASATRAFARTERFMPMNPAAPESAPPIMKPIAVSTFRRSDQEDREQDRDHGDDRVLAGQVGLGALLDGAGDLPHPIVAGRAGEQPLGHERRRRATPAPAQTSAITTP